MKQHFPLNIHVSYLWIPFLLLAFYVDTLKIIFFIFIMLFLHEMAHLTFAYLFHYKISKIIVYPFGVGAQIAHMGQGSVYKEMIIIIAGPLTHLLFPYLFQLLFHFQFISFNFMNYLIEINYAILLFNLLPIYPLDGGRLLQSLMDLIFPFGRAQFFTFILSIINIFIVFLFIINVNISSFIVIIFLLFQIVVGFYQRRLTRLQFYHYRLNHPVSYRIYAHKHHDLYRQRYNLINSKKGWIMEEQWLNHYFHDQVTDSPKTFIIL